MLPKEALRKPGRPIHVDEKGWMAYAEKLMQYILSNPSVVMLRSAIMQTDGEYGDVIRAVDLHPAFAEAMLNCRRVLADRLQSGAIHKQYDGSFVSKILAFHDPDYKAMQREDARIAAAESMQHNHSVQVIVKRYDALAISNDDALEIADANYSVTGPNIAQ